VTDLAETLEAGLARAREHQANVGRADELALRLAAHEAGLPMEHPVAEMFLNQYRGPADADTTWQPPGIGKSSTASHPPM
jgi:hypothetical protein